MSYSSAMAELSGFWGGAVGTKSSAEAVCW